MAFPEPTITVEHATTTINDPYVVDAVYDHAADEAHATEAHTTKESGIHVALAPEQLGTIAGVPITNTLVTTWLTMAILIGIAYAVRRNLTVVPGKTQVAFEEIITAAKKFFTQTLEDEGKATKYLPLLLTLFLFIAVANTLNVLPGLGSIGFTHDGHFTALLRGVNSDLNTTLALTIVSVFVIQFSGILALGLFKYAHKFINFSSPINFFVGLVELVGELARFVSFAFRLFGNIFAGKVLIAVLIFFVPYIVPVPVLAFEMFVGVVQALIFMLLTLFFLKLAVTPHEEEH
jgi:F-type H+-transporting ATPase subunit a